VARRSEGAGRPGLISSEFIWIAGTGDRTGREVARWPWMTTSSYYSMAYDETSSYVEYVLLFFVVHYICDRF
jgi:hypothetical protein